MLSSPEFKLWSIFQLLSGSILAVTMADPNANGKINRFVGICIQRGGKGLGATFVLRNIIDSQGEGCFKTLSLQQELVLINQLVKVIHLVLI